MARPYRPQWAVRCALTGCGGALFPGGPEGLQTGQAGPGAERRFEGAEVVPMRGQTERHEGYYSRNIACGKRDRRDGRGGLIGRS